MKILVLAGSARANSNTRGLAQAVRAHLESAQAEQFVTDTVCYNDRCELVHEDSQAKLGDMVQQLVRVTHALRQTI